jgi:tetratricopeptide (TPR) repeat protein
MELVRGRSITQYCDDQRLALRDRLSLFVSVCRAVQHAHQKGVIHRDLKPSNILVATCDDVPTPKVIDFGVAKAIDQPLTAKTLETGFGAVVGTPDYMSPEQARLNAADVDTRSDIYALGAVLYELLTGTTPLTHDWVRGGDLLEVLRKIRDEEPTKPSRRLAEVRDRPAEGATDGADPRFDLRVPRCYELDWIVMKCLEKDPARRYESATGLAHDLERYLADEPVSASPPSRWYRTRKFARRHRRPLATAAAFGVLLIAAAAVSVWLAVWARVAEREARESEERTRQERDKAVAAVARADEAGEIEREVRAFLQTDVLRQASGVAQADWGTPANPKLTVREALDRAAARIGDRFAHRPLVEAGVRLAIGDAYLGVGEARLAVPHLERAVALRRGHASPGNVELIDAMDSLASAYNEANRGGEALAVLLEMAQLAEGDQGPDLKLSMVVLARAFHSGSITDAIQLHELTLERQKRAWGPDNLHTLESAAGLAMAYQYAGRYPEMAALLEDTVERMKATLSAEHPRTLSTMDLLAEAYQNTGRVPQTIPLREQVARALAAKHGEDHPEVLHSQTGLANAYRLVGRPADAVALHESVCARVRRKHGDDHTETLRSLHGLAAAYEDAGQPDRAEAALRELVGRRRGRPVSGHLENAIALCDLAAFLMRQHRFREAEPALREALAIREKRFPDGWQTAQVRSELAEALMAEKRFADAEPLLLAAVPVLDRHAQEPGALGPKGAWAAAVRRLAALYEACEKPAVAAEWRRKLPARK